MKKKYVLLFLLLFLTGGFTAAQDIDYLILSPGVFLENAVWKTTLVDLLKSRGFVHPHVIQISTNISNSEIASVIAGYYNGNPLKYVLLIGNGKNVNLAAKNISSTYQYSQHGVVCETADELNGTFIPFFSVHSSNYWNPNGYVDVASDDPYVSGLTSHGKVYIGRVPAATKQEVANYVNKLKMYYENCNTYSQHYDKELILNLDVTHASNQCTADLVNDINVSVEDHIPSYVNITRLNVSENYNGAADYSEGGAFGHSQTRESMFESSINSGVSVISAIGTNGGPYNLCGWYWANSSYNLTNINTSLPFLFAPNCHQGEVNSPDYESAMRKLLVAPNGGIIGTMAPTEGTEQHVNGYLLNRFHDMIYEDQKTTYGEIFSILKSELAGNYPEFEFYYNSFTYFGDPSLTPRVMNVTNTFKPGWKTTSIPVGLIDYTGTKVYPENPTADMYCYVPGTGYVTTTMLENGPGYWIKFADTTLIKQSGYEINYQEVAVKAGWNLIGSVSHEIPVPNSNRAALVYYVDGGNILTDYILPGRGHWFKAQTDGIIILDKNAGLSKTTTDSIDFTKMDKFIVSDGAGNSQTLYVVNAAIDSSAAGLNMELPPAMPEGFFDARFETGEMLKCVYPDSGTAELDILVQSQNYPVSMSWEINPENGITYSFINDSSIGKVSKIQETSGSVSISRTSSNIIKLSASAGDRKAKQSLPTEYVLEQNYPNPFNPVTTITYQLPKDGMVTLKIYDAIGTEVITLVNEYKPTGRYNVTFNASSLASGVYFCRMQVNDFTSSKKLILMK